MLLPLLLACALSAMAAPSWKPGIPKVLLPEPPQRVYSVESFIASSRSTLSTAPAVPVAPFANLPLPLRFEELKLPFAFASAPASLRPLRAFSPQGTPSWLEQPLGVARMVPVESPTASGSTVMLPELASVLAILERHRELLRLASPARELELLSMQHDELGFYHLRFQQTYEGVPIWGADLYVHLRSDGTLELLNGRYRPTPVGISTKPHLSAAEAIARAWQELGRPPEPLPPMLDAERASARLVLFPHPVTGAIALCYEVQLIPSVAEAHAFFIDALTGALRWHMRLEQHCTLGLATTSPAGAPPHHQASARASRPQSLHRTPQALQPGSFADAQAVDLNGVQRRLRVYRHDDGVYYMIWDLPSLDAGRSQLPNKVVGGILTLTANNTDVDPRNPRVYHVTSPNNSWSDAVAVSAHYNAKVCYDYYRTTHNRNSIDGQGGTIISIVHATYKGRPMDNAYWNPGLKVMVYGDGATDFKPLAGGLDVSAHEMTHGVIQHTADLAYQFQSGALNESFADVFAVMIDREDFLLGEDVVRTGHIALRDLANPSNPQVLSPQPSHMSQYQNLPIEQDNGGVHINSGIPNRAAYLLISAIGREKAERIFYRALANYLTRTSEFIDCRRAVIRAAQELYGQTEANAAAQAYDAVGILDGGGSGGGSGNEVPPVSGGTQYIALIAGTQGEIGIINLATGQSGILSTSDPRTRVLVAQDGYPLSQLSTARNGSRIWFINQRGRIAVADLAQGQFFELPLYISQPGDLRNICVSADERIAGVLSAYADRSLYLTDGQQLARIELLPVSMDGPNTSTLLYADVMSWSPNPRQPRIAFDGFNVLPFAGDTLAYWNIYEMQFVQQGSTITPVIIPLANPNFGYSLGNITYSNTDPDLVSFNALEHQTGGFYLVVAYWQTGQIGVLGPGQLQYQGIPLTDLQRPTFSPDSRRLCVVSPQQQLLIVLDLQQGQAQFAPAQVPLFHPRWFVMGGVGIASTAPASSAFQAALLPGGELLVRYELSEACRVELELVDAFGRSVAQPLAEWYAAGAYERSIPLPNTLAAGWYGVRFRAGAAQALVPIVLVR